MRLCGCTFVLTDTLVYELCTGRRESLWIETQRKLWEFADTIEVWRHTGGLIKDEISAQAPVESPLSEELTNRMRSWLQRRIEYVPDDLQSLIRRYYQQREVDSVEAATHLCRAVCEICSGPYRQIRRDLSSGKDLRPLLEDLVNQDQMVKLLIKVFHGCSENKDSYIVGAENDLGHEWFAYQHARGILALFCVFMLKYGEKDNPGKEFRNTIQDADYAVLLHYADALATNETIGSMSDMCSWLYRGTKKIFSTSDIDNEFPDELNIREAAYYRWQHRNRSNGTELGDWLNAERELCAKIWDRLGLER